ncbi:protein max [Copidosoma floridanum]|uniref:protein max n=1 Tax=Copidosoma floridanum TaxID=29053 RepID=UPI0006C95877|nr:protein max [Copidosoma floridanum]
MSDDDRDIDIESDDGDDDPRNRLSNNQQFSSQAEKRAHHNALERRRRDHIKDSFSSLRDAVPLLSNEKAVSRAQILKKAAEYIQTMKRRNNSHQSDIENMKKQNARLEQQILALERAKVSGQIGLEALNACKPDGDINYSNDSDTESTDSESHRPVRHPKKFKVASMNH